MVRVTNLMPKRLNFCPWHSLGELEHDLHMEIHIYYMSISRYSMLGACLFHNWTLVYYVKVALIPVIMKINSFFPWRIQGSVRLCGNAAIQTEVSKLLFLLYFSHDFWFAVEWWIHPLSQPCKYKAQKRSHVGYAMYIANSKKKQ
jgi:hypothetical protein